MLINKPMDFHHDILNGCLVTEHKRQECKVNFLFQRVITLKICNVNLKFLCSARPFVLVNNVMKFHQDILNGSQVTKRT